MSRTPCWSCGRYGVPLREVNGDPICRDCRNGSGPAGKTLRRLDVARMVREEPPPVPWIVEGLAVEGCLTMVSGREGEGKSLLAQAVAAGVELGEEVAGLACRQGRALIVDGENGEYEIHRRVHSLGLPATVEVREAENFHLESDLDELISVVEDVRPTLLVLDSFSSLWPGGDENDPPKVTKTLAPLRNYVRSQGVAALLLHHLPKSGSNYRGTTAIGANVELGFKLSRDKDDPENEDRRRLDCFKCRPAREPGRRWLRLHAERSRVYVDRAAAYKVEDEPERPRPARAELAPEMLAAAKVPITWPDLARAIERSPKDGTARRLRDDLIEAGELSELGDGRLTRVPGCHPPIGDLANGTLNGGPPDGR